SASRELRDSRPRLGDPGYSCLRGYDPWLHPRSHRHPAAWPGTFHLRRLHDLYLRLVSNTLAREPACRAGVVRFLRRVFRLSSTAAVPALALGLSTKHCHV